jgi:hypothetical protein
VQEQRRERESVQEEKDFHALLQVKYFVNKFFSSLSLYRSFTCVSQTIRISLPVVQLSHNTQSARPFCAAS